MALPRPRRKSTNHKLDKSISPPARRRPPTFKLLLLRRPRRLSRPRLGRCWTEKRKRRSPRRIAPRPLKPGHVRRRPSPLRPRTNCSSSPRPNAPLRRPPSANAVSSTYRTFSMGRIKQWWISLQQSRRHRSQVRDLSRQWRQGVRAANLQALPLHMMLEASLSGMEATLTAERERTDSSRDLLRPSRQIKRRNASASSASARPASRILRLFRLLPSSTRRRLGLWSLVKLLQVLRLYLGIQRRCNLSSTSSSRQRKK